MCVSVLFSLARCFWEQLPGGGGREFQRLVGYARLLAEMYNYAVVGSPTVFETLHLLLDSGHEVSAARRSAREVCPVPWVP